MREIGLCFFTSTQFLFIKCEEKHVQIRIVTERDYELLYVLYKYIFIYKSGCYKGGKISQSIQFSVIRSRNSISGSFGHSFVRS